MTQQEARLGIQFSDIPDKVSDDALAYAASYVIGLVRFDRNDGQLMGSGTLVRVGKNSGILTARHVLDGFPDTGEIGLILPKPNQENSRAMKPVIRVETTKRHTFPLGARECDGPDLAFLELATYDVEKIEASKSFYPLDLFREEILADQSNFSGRAFILTGFPDEMTKRHYFPEGQQLVMKFTGGLYLSQIQHLPDANSFDYVDLSVWHDQEKPPPRSFGGYSGGGLWHLQMRGNTASELELAKCTLFGVAFYQSGIVDGFSRIRCHFRRSVYEQLFNKVVGST